jgi:RNA 2',3'-cyclic 3'-phosphodiesterase
MTLEAEERWRCFVAVPIGETLRGALSDAVDALRAKAPAVFDELRWTEPEAWHLTLAFLGPISPKAVPALAASMTEVAVTHPPFAVPTGGLGAFPSRRDVRVLWYGVTDRSRRMAELAVEVRKAVGLEASAPFRAHLTLARARGDRGHPLAPAIRDAVFPAGTLNVERLVLFRGHLGSGPPRYEMLAEAALTAPAPAGGNR